MLPGAREAVGTSHILGTAQRSSTPTVLNPQTHMKPSTPMILRGLIPAAILLATTIAPAQSRLDARGDPDHGQPQGNGAGHPTQPTVTGPQFGDPLPNLTTSQLADFTAGLLNFQEEETIATGLGPDYN